MAGVDLVCVSEPGRKSCRRSRASFAISVPFEFIVQRGEPMGDRTVHVTVRYQACSGTVCMPPSHASFDLVLRERAASD